MQRVLEDLPLHERDNMVANFVDLFPEIGIARSNLVLFADNDVEPAAV